MSITTCTTCGHTQTWNWEEAFDKFGFGDGDDIVMTEHVAEALRKVGYIVNVEAWGCHNVVITSIERRGKSLIPDNANLGYADPRDYLPARIVKFLDRAFTDNTEVEP